MTTSEATITSRTNTLGIVCAYDVTTPDGRVVPFQSYSYAKAYVSKGCPA